jgi:hypothetical protein
LTINRGKYLAFISLYKKLRGKKALTLLRCCFDINDYQTEERELRSLRRGDSVSCPQNKKGNYRGLTPLKLEGFKIVSKNYSELETFVYGFMV